MTAAVDVLVTGIGVVAPSGLGREPVWEAAVAGKCAIDMIGSFDPSAHRSRLAGRLDGFDAAEHFGSRTLTQTDRVTRFALLASDEAVADSGLDPPTLDPERIGVTTSNATGGFEFTHREMAKLWTQGPDAVSVYQSFAWFYAVNTGQISIRHGVKGPSSVLSAEQSGGLDAIGYGLRGIHRGDLDVVLAGGFESSFDPWGWASHCASGTVSEARSPELAYLPFDARANGHVPGEGGALLVLEAAGHASGRGRDNPYGRLTGHAATFDPPGHRPDGLERAARQALAQAGRAPGEIDLVLADGAGAAALDAQEAEAISAVFGARGVPVSVPKSGVGRLMAGGGPLDATFALLAVRDGVIPPTVNVAEPPAHYGLDLVVGDARPATVHRVLILARGAEGFNSALVVERA
ncbi:beta-ketoacyl synthase N-terminal-like domain-containing protein [Pseudonocardia sp. HH130630-07]|uniref:beta-ketoacyl synthase N-terminal-like domain-containing protein n=1 Tax=Pseudonocardia sp. HH130630-07 TaxID=1690815 RepID=UPI000814FE46|nr:beta-ketoacyl synthase N-terminal-like domain-containing protein [Pseudonocardia sp. HH130630-07]ANY10846.1 beta-ketoacyl synthase [Pseudonocardia sp. HH130630-07]